MPPTFAEYKALLAAGESVGRTHTPALETALGMIKTAAVSFEHLTNDPNWDRFLSYLQDMLEEARKESRHYMEMTVNTEGSVQKQSQWAYHAAHAKVELLERIMSLPMELKRTHDEIKSR